MSETTKPLSPEEIEKSLRKATERWEKLKAAIKALEEIGNAWGADAVDREVVLETMEKLESEDGELALPRHARISSRQRFSPIC